MPAVLAVDTETGGLLPSRHALLSIGAVCNWGELPFLVYVTPESQPLKEIDPAAAQVNGYTPELWKKRGAVPLKEAMGQFRDWLQVRLAERRTAVLVCHNLTFDRGFLDEAAWAAAVELPGRYHWDCSMLEMGRLMRRGVIRKGSAGLARLGELAGVPMPARAFDGTHDALEDAKVCLSGYLWMQSLQDGEMAMRRLYKEGLKERRAADALICSIAAYMDLPLGDLRAEEMAARMAREVNEWATRVRNTERDWPVVELEKERGPVL